MGWKLDFCSGQYPLFGRIQLSDGDTPCAAVLKQLFILSQGGACALLTMSIFQFAFALKYLPLGVDIHQCLY